MGRGAPSLKLLTATAAIVAYVLSSRYQEAPSTFSSWIRTFLIIYGFFGTLWFSWVVVIWPRYISPLKHIPSPPGAQAFWNSFLFIAEEESGVHHRRWLKSVPNDGLLRYLLLGGMERVFLTSPKAISDAYVGHCYDYERPEIAHRILSRFLGQGLILAEGDVHRVQRKNLTPAFSYRHVKDLVPIFWQFASKLARQITHQIDPSKNVIGHSKNNVIPFDQWINRATLDIIGATGLGFDFGALDDPDNQLSAKYRAAFDPTPQEILLQVLSVFIPFQYLEYLPLSRNRVVRDSIGSIRMTARELIEKKRLQRDFDDRKDVLSVALRSGAFTVDELVEQVMTFLAAGHETTSTASQWAMVTLAQRPAMQQRLRAEIREALPSVDKDDVYITSESFEQLPYLRAFCQEVLRFWAPVPFTQREAIRDTEILGQRIPKGTNIVVVPSAINHSKILWGEDADQFNPERWLQPGCMMTGGVESPYANLTFGAGPRGCIGSTFAKHEFHCLVAALVGRFEIELDPPDRVVESKTSTVTRPKDGLPLRMKVIEGW